MLTIALTGASGFIGSRLLDHLSARGFRIKALFRPRTSSPPKSTESVEWFAGNLEDKDSLRAFVSGADVVVHCAGAVRGTSLNSFAKVNADGVENLLQVSIEQRVPRFLLISSLAAREPSLSAYAASKKMGEQALLRASDRISWDILRPPAVYGPGDKEMRPLLRMINRGIVPVVGRKEGHFSLIHVDDLAAAVSCLLVSERTGKGECFELHDGHSGGYTWHQIADIATRLNGKKPLCFSIPRKLLDCIGSMNAFLAGFFGYQPMLTPGKVREVFHPDWTCDNTALTRATGWCPRILFEDGIKRLFCQK